MMAYVISSSRTHRRGLNARMRQLTPTRLPIVTRWSGGEANSTEAETGMRLAGDGRAGSPSRPSPRGLRLHRIARQRRWPARERVLPDAAALWARGGGTALLLAQLGDHITKPLDLFAVLRPVARALGVDRSPVVFLSALHQPARGAGVSRGDRR